jgi:hypothetical protein
MFGIIQRFGKHCSCHLQGESVVVGRFLKPHIGQAVVSELVLICEEKERAAIQNLFRHLLSSPLVTKKKVSPPLFISHVLFSHWIAARSSAPPISTIKSNSPPTT